jgi:hypothetical protein
LIFKIKTPDVGERYLDRCPENTVVAPDDNGKNKVIDLSHPVNCLRLSAVELTSIFNHPAIHKHGKAAPASPQEPLHLPIDEESPPGATVSASEIEVPLREVPAQSPPTPAGEVSAEAEPTPENVIPLEIEEPSSKPGPNC